VIVAPPFDAGAVKAMVACPLPGVADPMVGGPGATAPMVIENACVAVPEVFVAVTTPVNVPETVGVPLSTPVVPFSDNPVGKAPDVRLNAGAGVPLATYVCEYATPTGPPAGAALLKIGEDSGVTLTVPDAALAPTALLAFTEQV
jgi:hypothetical protein